MDIRAVALFLALIAAQWGASHARVVPKGVTASLTAKWPPAPLVHEAAEFLADESPEAFWDFARRWKAPSPDATDAQCWDALKTEASSGLSPTMSRILELSLASRQYSPRLEALRQLAAAAPPSPLSDDTESDVCCFAVVGGVAVTDASDLEASLAAALEAPQDRRRRGPPTPGATLTAVDHIYASAGLGGAAPNATAASTVPAILYAPLGAPCAAPLDATLRALADAHPRVGYAWRPVVREGGDCAAPARAGACTALGTAGPLALHGYGVELAIKNMEYNARDDSSTKNEKKDDKNGAPADADLPDEVAGFQFATLLSRRPELREELLTFRDHLLASTSQEQALKVWDLKDLGLQAAQRVASASDPLHLLGEVAGNFPLLVEALSKGAVNSSLRSDAAMLGQALQGRQYMTINGVPYDLENLNLYDFIDALRREVRLLDSLAAAGLTPEAAREAAALRGAQGGEGGRGGGGGSETSRLDVRPSADAGEVVWVNDLEKDEAYADLPRPLMALLQPSFMGGGIPAVRRNLFTALLLFDPATPSGASLGADVAGMLEQRWPIRVGLMPVSLAHEEDRSAAKVARLVAAVAAEQGGAAAAAYLARVFEKVGPPKPGAEPYEFVKKLAKVSERAFPAAWDAWNAAQEGVLDAMSGSAAKYAALNGSSPLGTAADRLLSATAALASAKGLTPQIESSGGVVVLNGVVAEVEGVSGWRATLGGLWQGEMQGIAGDIYRGRLKDSSKDLYADILAAKGAVPRHNPRVMPSEPRSKRMVRLNAAADADGGARQVALALADLKDLPVRYFDPSNPVESSVDEDIEGDDTYDDYGGGGFGGPSGNAKQLAKEDAEVLNAAPPLVTHWVVVNAADSAALAAAADAVAHDGGVSRRGVVVNPSSSPDSLSPLEALVVAAAAGIGPLGAASRADLIDFYTALAAKAETNAVLDRAPADTLNDALPEGAARDMGVPALLSKDAAAIAAAAAAHRAFARRTLGLGPGASAVVSNGRVLALRGPGDIIGDDFTLIDLGARRHMFAGAPTARLLAGAGLTGSTRAGADAAAALSSILTALQPEEPTFGGAALGRLFGDFKRSPLMLSSPSSADKKAKVAPLHVQAVLNPLTKTAQAAAPLLAALRSALDPDLQVLLTPQRDYSDMPLKTFYRFVAPEVGAGPPGTGAPPAAVFAALPPHKTLTLGMDVPEGWLVEPVRAANDLDNLRLEELAPGERAAEAEFQLEALLVTGMCVDAAAAAQRKWDAVHPRGVQLELAAASDPTLRALSDTIVMSNLGYFQLKAAPGLWSLGLAQGRSEDLYRVESSSAGGAGLEPAPPPIIPGGPHRVPVAVVGFGDRDVVLVLRKDPMMGDADVLDPSTDPVRDTLWSRITGKYPDEEEGAKKKKRKKKKKNPLDDLAESMMGRPMRAEGEEAAAEGSDSEKRAAAVTEGLGSLFDMVGGMFGKNLFQKPPGGKGKAASKSNNGANYKLLMEVAQTMSRGEDIKGDLLERLTAAVSASPVLSASTKLRLKVAAAKSGPPDAKNLAFVLQALLGRTDPIAPEAAAAMMEAFTKTRAANAEAAAAHEAGDAEEGTWEEEDRSKGSLWQQIKGDEFDADAAADDSDEEVVRMPDPTPEQRKAMGALAKATLDLAGGPEALSPLMNALDMFQALMATKDALKRGAEKMASGIDPSEMPVDLSDPNTNPDTIHVFTVASGHMYERLQKIMVLSALKRTRSRLKFWFIKNYMSPGMKEFVPLMAKQYGFDYEFVTYKWPTWLHKQTEKQRTIWAYKILFLDVLFPLNLKKVIFCDSDQVIRADLKELWDMDLKGAPYGYTPFCDSEPAMDGFRFWKQGFWKDHLQGKPYHISALYVVDLERFRATAAGDRLRVIYDGLSKDPNSLSNLDQDLPNYAQDTVPIHSLPQEWLWCETWCGNATRPSAKTIDLCNNPLTKEPKLQSARRIIAEWPDLDREAREFTALAEAVLEGRSSESDLVAAEATRFKTYLEPMVEGSVKTSGGDEPPAAVEETMKEEEKRDEEDEREEEPAHDPTEL